MAYAALLSVARVIDEILPHEQDYTSLCGKHQMISLHQSIISLQNFLEVVPGNCASMTSQLESRLTDLVYRLEDFIESNLKGSPCEVMQVAAANVALLPSMFCRFIEEVDSILQEAKEVEELFKQNTKAVAGRDSQATSLSIVEQGSRVGIKEDLQRIIERVTSHEKSLQIIPVVGMGGIGKTTVARAVYEDLDIINHFDVCFWVTVSQEYNVQEILKGLLEGQKPIDEKDAESLSVQKTPTVGKSEPLDVQVHKRLHKRRFLIVMDDMWDEKAWQGILSAIPKDQTYSRIILTTRLSHVAEKVSSSGPQHQMQFMDKETSWDLLRKNIYGGESCPPELEDLGRRIAVNCDGLPLTIIVVAGLLKSNMNNSYWEQVERNINEAATRDGRLDAVLSLSYNNLPPHLKSCFLYMGAFPEDFCIPTRDLLCLWVAEGFIKPRASQRLEETAEEYLEDLVKRNLLLVVAKRSNGTIRSCSIHDVPRELSLRIAKQDKFLQRVVGYYQDVNFQDISTSQRHVSVSTKRSDLSTYDACYNTFVRSLLFMNIPTYHQLKRFRLLKVLYGVRVSAEYMFGQIFELTNLRLLQFSCIVDDIKRWASIPNSASMLVPKSISKLQKLETLIVTEGTIELITISEDIWKIPNLRHVVIPRSNCTLLFPLSSETNPVLEHLQTLSWATGFSFTRFSIRGIPNLKKLRIGYASKFTLNCSDLRQLENLAIRGWCNITGISCLHSIKKLCLHDCGNSWERLSSLIGSLPNLQVLKLEYYTGVSNTWEPKEGEFLRLKYLEIRNSSLQHWLAESTHFPCLENLVLVYLRNLMEVPLDIGYISTLQKLIVKGCSSFVDESAKIIREEQENAANHLLQVVIS